MINLNVKAKTMKLLKGKDFAMLEFAKFSYYIKSMNRTRRKLINRTSSKLKTSALEKTS